MEFLKKLKGMNKMEDINVRVKDLMVSGLNCSQTMLFLSQEMRNAENKDVIYAMAGLGGGMSSGKACGALTGGACLISSYIVKDLNDEEAKMLYRKLVKEFVNWFEEEFGSTECRDLVLEDRESRMKFCPDLVAKCFTKAMEILSDNGIDVYE